jgi:hypothetical protein
VATPTLPLDTVWQQVLGKLQPMTKALLQSHCRLLHLEGATVKVGVKNETLLRHAHSKLTEIEAAFTHVCQQKIKALFIVSGDIVSGSASTALPPTPSPAPIVEREPAPERAPSPDPPLRSPTPPGSDAPAALPDPPAPLPIADLASPYSSSELQKAVETVAKLFEGEIIDLGDTVLDSPVDSPTPVPLSLANPPLIRGRPDLSAMTDDEDIPF